VDFIPKHIDINVLKARVKTHINLSKSEVLYALARAGEYKDNETGARVHRMSRYAKIIAGKLIQNKEWLESLLVAAPMHDIGKIGIPDAVMLKEGLLDANEWKIMKTHPQVGDEIIGNNNYSEVMLLAKEIASGHHEKWDGSGYPLGLIGEDIPFSARVVALADVFDPSLAEPFHQALPEMLDVKEAFKDAVD